MARMRLIDDRRFVAAALLQQLDDMEAGRAAQPGDGVPARHRCFAATVTRWSQRKLLLAGSLALVMAIPAPANSFTLDQLLDLPIEQLLRLEITSRHPPKVAALWSPSATGLRAVEHRDAT